MTRNISKAIANLPRIPMGRKLTLKDVTFALCPEMSVWRVDGEYRINFKGGAEATAYYTNDADDAINTGRDMLKRRWLSERNVRQGGAR